MTTSTISLDAWLTDQAADAHVSAAIAALAQGAIDIAAAVEAAPLQGNLGAADNVNVQGEDQKVLDVMSNDIAIAALNKCAAIRAMVSEENEDVIQNAGRGADANLLVCFDPLDGSSNIETSGTIGTIFSIADLGEGETDVSSAEALSALPAKQIAAGYFLYGAATLLIMTTGKSVAMFAHNPQSGAFELARPDVRVQKSAAEFSINMSYQKYWAPGLRTYIDECLAGKTGPRGKTFNMRWAGSMVADVHRVFARGGIFIYPALDKKGSENGKLRLLYEGYPMAMLIEVAGGKAMAGTRDFADITPTSLHQRTPLALGSAEEVEQLRAKLLNDED